MKKILPLTMFLMVFVLTSSSQVPQEFKYQAVVRDAQHAVISNQDVGFKMCILEGSADGSPVYEETHTVTTSAVGLADLVIGDGSVVSGVFDQIIWGESLYFLEVEVDPSGGSSYEHIGTSQLVSVPYALYSGNISSPTRKFTIQEDMGHPVDSALFEVKNVDGQTVFAVYPEGTRVYVLDEDAKGRKGGFAVGGYSKRTKGVTREYMHVSADSIRIYVDEEATKGRKGGFAVGGYSKRTKGVTDHYFELRPDSVKFLMVSDQPPESGSGALTVKTKSTFGGDESGNASLFNLTRDNYFIGHLAGNSITTGDQNCFIGFESGVSNSVGYGNVFLGLKSGMNNESGDNNVFIGVESGQHNTGGMLNTSVGFQAGAHSTTGNSNSIFGFWAGFDNQAGELNTYLGAHSGHLVRDGNSNTYIGAYSGSEVTTGTYNVFIGMRAGSHVGSELNTILGAYAGAEINNGGNNVFVGANSGRGATGQYGTFVGHNTGLVNEGHANTYIGSGAGANSINGTENVFIGHEAGADNNGVRNVFIGYSAGMHTVGSETLIINSSEGDSTSALIWGRFDQDLLRLNNRVGIGRNAMSHALEVEGDVSKTTAGDFLVNSDARIKTEVIGIENACDLISELHPVKFRYTDAWMEMNPGIADKVYYNFIAQEFGEVFPESVSRGGDNLGSGEDLLQMDSYPAQVVAIRAIQELAQQNREQQEIIEVLLEKVARLEEDAPGR